MKNNATGSNQHTSSILGHPAQHTTRPADPGLTAEFERRSYTQTLMAHVSAPHRPPAAEVHQTTKI